MTKLNFLLLALVVYCAMLVVEYQHESRTLFVKLGGAQQLERHLEVAFNRLQLEQVMLAKGERIDRIAREQLKMQQPTTDQTVFMSSDGSVFND